jgi:hypothetical protein
MHNAVVAPFCKQGNQPFVGCRFIIRGMISSYTLPFKIQYYYLQPYPKMSQNSSNKKF